MKKKNGQHKLSLKKSVVYSLERAATGQVLGGDGNTSRSAVAIPPGTLLCTKAPQPKPANVNFIEPEDGPVCTGR